MGIITKLHYEESVINLLSFSQSFEQNHDVTGRPSSKPTGGLFDITFETIKNDPFLEYMLNETKISYLKIHIQPAVLGGRSRIIELRDIYVINHRDNFNDVNNEPMTTYIKLSPGSMVVNGQTMFVKYWADADPNAPVVAPTTIDDEKEITNCYMTNTNGEKIEDYKIDDIIILNIETLNRIGDIITINLDDAEYDFEHNGVRLENDTLRGIEISNDLEQIELKVVAQKK